MAFRSPEAEFQSSKSMGVSRPDVTSLAAFASRLDVFRAALVVKMTAPAPAKTITPPGIGVTSRGSELASDVGGVFIASH